MSSHQDERRWHRRAVQAAAAPRRLGRATCPRLLRHVVSWHRNFLNSQEALCSGYGFVVTIAAEAIVAITIQYRVKWNPFL